MLSEADLPLRFIERAAYFDFLGPQDEPWLRVLLGEMVRFEGRRRRELCQRLAEPLPCDAPHFKRRAATRVLLGLWRREREAAVPPVQARARLFGAAAAARAPTESVWGTVAGQMGVTSEALALSLFADLPGERIMRAPTPVPSASELALRTNLAVAQAVLMRASTIELHVEGGVRPIVRLAKLRGLLCTVVDSAPAPAPASTFAPAGPSAAGNGSGATGRSNEPRLNISGPFSLFHHTLLYGRALAALLPHLAWCARFDLRATCALRGRSFDVGLDTTAPIFPAAAPRPFDSHLEERFAQDMSRLAPDWDILREPEPVRAGSTLIFPDFLMRHRIHPERRVLIEIAGFWTPDYLSTKFARLREAGLTHLVVCVDADRACATGEPPPGLCVVPFRRRVDAAAVMREVEIMVAASAGVP